MRDATKWMRRSSCSWKKEGTRRQQKYLTVVKQFSKTRRLLPLIFSTEGLSDLQKVKLIGTPGTKSLSTVTRSSLPAAHWLGVLRTSTWGKHRSMVWSTAARHWDLWGALKIVLKCTLWEGTGFRNSTRPITTSSRVTYLSCSERGALLWFLRCHGWRVPEPAALWRVSRLSTTFGTM